MTIYEFYREYILTHKALLVTNLRSLLSVSVRDNVVCLAYASTPDSIFLKVSFHVPITYLSNYGIKVSLVIDPIFISASTLTGVISIPVSEPDELPF